MCTEQDTEFEDEHDKRTHLDSCDLSEGGRSKDQRLIKSHVNALLERKVPGP